VCGIWRCKYLKSIFTEFPYCQQPALWYTVSKLETRSEEVHVVSRKPFIDAARKYPNDSTALSDIYRTLKRIDVSNPDELKNFFPSLDRMVYRKKWWIIDVGGNNLRIMFFADFEISKIFIKHISTHSEYDKLNTFYRRNAE